MIMGIFLLPLSAMNEIPEAYLVELIRHQSIIYTMERNLCCYFLICLETQSLILLDLETRLSVSIVPMTTNPKKDLLDLAKKWSTALATKNKNGDKNEH